MDAGESAAECCAREVLEETGLIVHVQRLIGIYTTPHRVTEYADGNRKQCLDLVFEALWIGGDLSNTDEATEVGYFSREEMTSMDVIEPIYERVDDAFAAQDAAVVR